MTRSRATVAEFGIDDLAQPRLIRLVDAVVRTHDIGEPTLCDELLQPNDWLLVELERDKSARFREQGDQRSAAAREDAELHDRCRFQVAAQIDVLLEQRRRLLYEETFGRRIAAEARARTPCRPRR